MTKIKYKKIGGGTFLLNGKIIKPNQEFTAYPGEVPEAFKDVCKVLGAVDEGGAKLPPEEVEKLEEKQEPEKKLTYELVKTSVGWYDVHDTDGNKINEKALRKIDAEALVESLGT